MQSTFERCVLFSSIKSCIQNICSVSLVRETSRVSLSLFWTSPAPTSFTKLVKISVSVLRRLNVLITIYLDDILLIGYTIGETLMVRDTVIFLLQQLGFVLNLVSPTHRKELLGATVNSLIITLSVLEKKSVKSSEAVCGTSSENTSVNFSINETNRLVVFNYSSSISSTNKFQVPTKTTNTSTKNPRGHIVTK